MGRPTPEPGEPLWLDDDQDKVNAYLKLERTLCPRCGTAEADWVHPGTKRLLEEPKWEPTTFRCHGCATLGLAEKEVPDREVGVRVVLVPWRDRDDDEDEG